MELRGENVILTRGERKALGVPRRVAATAIGSVWREAYQQAAERIAVLNETIDGQDIKVFPHGFGATVVYPEGYKELKMLRKQAERLEDMGCHVNAIASETIPDSAQPDGPEL